MLLDMLTQFARRYFRSNLGQESGARETGQEMLASRRATFVAIDGLMPNVRSIPAALEMKYEVLAAQEVPGERQADGDELGRLDRHAGPVMANSDDNPRDPEADKRQGREDDDSHAVALSPGENPERAEHILEHGAGQIADDGADNCRQAQQANADFEQAEINRQGRDRHDQRPRRLERNAVHRGGKPSLQFEYEIHG